MTCTTTNMSGRRIWGFDPDDPELTLARAAGWSRSDLVWERLMETALADWTAGARDSAVRRIGQAHLLGRLRFARTDPRRATTLANLALIDVARGNSIRAMQRQKQALAVWQSAHDHVAAMQIAPRTRSSLFHLRMEARHRDTFHDNIRARFIRFTDETAETLRGLTAPAPAPHRHYARWRGERPNVHDDTRKIMAACLLIIDRK